MIPTIPKAYLWDGLCSLNKKFVSLLDYFVPTPPDTAQEGYTPQVGADGEVEWKPVTGEGTFSEELTFDCNKLIEHTQTGAIAFTSAASGNLLGKTIMIELTGDNVNTVTFDSNFVVLTGSYDNTVLNYVYFHYVLNNKVLVSIRQA